LQQKQSWGSLSCKISAWKNQSWASPCDDLKSGRAKPVDGVEAFAKLRLKSKNDARRVRR